MKILIVLPHFYNAQSESKHASQGKDPRPRIMALSMALTSLQGLYSQSQCMINIGKCITIPVNQAPENQLDIIICTTGNCHLLSQLPLPTTLYKHHTTDSEPMMLGFECQAVLRDHLGKYDYYCYLEDDLILHDPWLFIKLDWFNSHAGAHCLLQPNRYEVSPHGEVIKAYIDGDLYPHLTANFQNVQDQPQFIGKVMEQPVKFQRPLNPHSGCYFLTAEQVEAWARQPYFLDRDCSFIGPLESAATLGIMKTFKIYKPIAKSANFLEIQHFGSNFLSLVGKQVKVAHVSSASSSQDSVL
ncbi:MAG: calcium-binding protein [Microcoleaceae cyanobacterium]